MARKFGIGDTTAREALQRATPAEASPPRPLPPGTPGRASAATVGIAADPSAFIVIGDHGGIENPEPQKLVAAAMADEQGVDFVYSAGDWVYFGGDEPGWVTQVLQPYSPINVPFLGIPGNHDDEYGGDPPFDPSRGPLDGWMANLCTPSPAVPPEDPQFEYQRHTETQPYCDWTLALDTLTIIGLWSNVPSGGYLYDSQTAWLVEELKAAPVDRPLIVSLHHPPYSVDAFHGGSASMGSALDTAFTAASRWPEMVLSGHVHDYQRFTRTTPDGKKITYVVLGNSGYHNLHKLASDATPGLDVLGDGTVIFEQGDDANYGFLYVAISTGGLGFDYIRVAKDGGGSVTADSFDVTVP